MRRRRFVAREFANDKRNDTYFPASGSHSSNLIPSVYLKMLSESFGSVRNSANGNLDAYKITLASLDIKDAFLQVPQEKVVMVSLYNQQHIIRKNIPGQRLGAKAWYWYFRDFVNSTLDCVWRVEQPCLAKCVVDGIHNCFMIHVDDLFFTASAEFWSNKFLPTMKAKFNISYNELQEDGSSISFLKRKLVKLADGLMIVPGTTVEKVVGCFERAFSVARVQKVPSDGSIQNEDSSQMLGANDSKANRSVISLLLNMARDRIDVMFTVKELASCMSSPSVCALQRLRKLIGYLKFSGNRGMKFGYPEHGCGKWKTGGENFFMVETFADADCKILWVQDLTMSGQMMLGQVPTDFNYSDLGTKPLARARMLALLNQIGVCNTDAQENVGAEEFQVTSEKLVSKQTLKKLAKTVFRMAAAWGLEPILPTGADAVDVPSLEGSCQLDGQPNVDSGDWWLWLLMVILFLLWFGFATAVFSTLRQLRKDLTNCWNQVAEEEEFVARLEQRINDMSQRLDRMQTEIEQNYSMLEDQNQQTSNELSMTHDAQQVCVTLWWSMEVS
eukprot:s97_g16.t1